MITFLDLEAYLRGDFLHPGGPITTQVLLQALILRPEQRVLELGCGSGATAALLARKNRVRLVALDRSSAMLQAARTRLGGERLAGSVRLIRADATPSLPFPDRIFDAVYAESVVALLEAQDVVCECGRVLRPGGRLALTERIWKPGVSQALADRVNAVSWQAFGIPAATRLPLDREDWLELLQGARLENLQAISVDTLLPTNGSQADWHVRRRLARAGRYLLRPRSLWRSLRFKLMMRRYAPLWSHLESFLFLARKPK